MCDDDIYQGPDTTEDRDFIAKELDLFSISSKYKKYWILDECSSMHRAIYLLIHKGVSFDIGDKIMQHIKSTIGNKDITSDNFTMTDKTLKKWGLSAEKISGIRSIISLPEVNSKNICKIKEGGIYLLKGFKVLEQEDDDVLWNNNYNVLKNMGILFYRDKSMSPQEAMTVGKNWAGYRSQISYFLCRLKPEGAIKILDEIELEPWDFFGCEKPKESDFVVSESNSKTSSSSSSRV